MLASSGGHGSLFMHGCWEGRRFNAGRARSAGRTSAGMRECRASGAGVPSHVMVPDGRAAGRWAGSSLILVGRLMQATPAGLRVDRVDRGRGAAQAMRPCHASLEEVRTLCLVRPKSVVAKVGCGQSRP